MTAHEELATIMRIPRAGKVLGHCSFIFNIFTAIDEKQSNGGLQLRRAISIQAEGARPLEKDAIAPSAARLCWMSPSLINLLNILRDDIFHNLVNKRRRPNSRFDSLTFSGGGVGKEFYGYRLVAINGENPKLFLVSRQ